MLKFNFFNKKFYINIEKSYLINFKLKIISFMKKFFFYFCSIISSAGFAQDFISKEFTPMKSPEATSFVNLNFMPLDEFSGKENISIPLYSIDLDGLNIPISLSYDTGGVKVNTVSSNVGLNWSLNAGGLINKEIVGGEDTQVSITPSDVSGSGYAYSEYGFLRDLFTWPSITNHPIINSLRDKQPDIYHVYAPGLKTILYIKVMEIL